MGCLEDLNIYIYIWDMIPTFRWTVRMTFGGFSSWTHGAWRSPRAVCRPRRWPNWRRCFPRPRLSERRPEPWCRPGCEVPGKALDTRLSTNMLYYGSFLKWRYPQIIQIGCSIYIFHYKQSSYFLSHIYGKPHITIAEPVVTAVTHLQVRLIEGGRQGFVVQDADIHLLLFQRLEKAWGVG